MERIPFGMQRPPSLNTSVASSMGGGTPRKRRDNVLPTTPTRGKLTLHPAHSNPSTPPSSGAASVNTSVVVPVAKTSPRLGAGGESSKTRTAAAPAAILSPVINYSNPAAVLNASDEEKAAAMDYAEAFVRAFLEGKQTPAASVAATSAPADFVGTGEEKENVQPLVERQDGVNISVDPSSSRTSAIKIFGTASVPPSPLPSVEGDSRRHSSHSPSATMTDAQSKAAAAAQAVLHSPLSRTMVYHSMASLARASTSAATDSQVLSPMTPSPISSMNPSSNNKNNNNKPVTGAATGTKLFAPISQSQISKALTTNQANIHQSSLAIHSPASLLLSHELVTVRELYEHRVLMDVNAAFEAFSAQVPKDPILAALLEVYEHRAHTTNAANTAAATSGGQSPSPGKSPQKKQQTHITHAVMRAAPLVNLETAWTRVGEVVADAIKGSMAHQIDALCAENAVAKAEVTRLQEQLLTVVEQQQQQSSQSVVNSEALSDMQESLQRSQAEVLALRRRLDEQERTMYELDRNASLMTARANRDIESLNTALEEADRDMHQLRTQARVGPAEDTSRRFIEREAEAALLEMIRLEAAAWTYVRAPQAAAAVSLTPRPPADYVSPRRRQTTTTSAAEDENEEVEVVAPSLEMLTDIMILEEARQRARLSDLCSGELATLLWSSTSSERGIAHAEHTAVQVALFDRLDNLSAEREMLTVTADEALRRTQLEQEQLREVLGLSSFGAAVDLSAAVEAARSNQKHEDQRALECVKPDMEDKDVSTTAPILHSIATNTDTTDDDESNNKALLLEVASTLLEVQTSTSLSAVCSLEDKLRVQFVDLEAFTRRQLNIVIAHQRQTCGRLQTAEAAHHDATAALEQQSAQFSVALVAAQQETKEAAAAAQADIIQAREECALLNALLKASGDCALAQCIVAEQHERHVLSASSVDAMGLLLRSGTVAVGLMHTIETQRERDATMAAISRESAVAAAIANVQRIGERKTIALEGCLSTLAIVVGSEIERRLHWMQQEHSAAMTVLFPEAQRLRELHIRHDIATRIREDCEEEMQARLDTAEATHAAAVEVVIAETRAEGERAFNEQLLEVYARLDEERSMAADAMVTAQSEVSAAASEASMAAATAFMNDYVDALVALQSAESARRADILVNELTPLIVNLRRDESLQEAKAAWIAASEITHRAAVTAAVEDAVATATAKNEVETTATLQDLTDRFETRLREQRDELLGAGHASPPPRLPSVEGISDRTQAFPNMAMLTAASRDPSSSSSASGSATAPVSPSVARSEAVASVVDAATVMMMQRTANMHDACARSALAAFASACAATFNESLLALAITSHRKEKQSREAYEGELREAVAFLESDNEALRRDIALAHAETAGNIQAHADLESQLLLADLTSAEELSNERARSEEALEQHRVFTEESVHRIRHQVVSAATADQCSLLIEAEALGRAQLEDLFEWTVVHTISHLYHDHYLAHIRHATREWLRQRDADQCEVLARGVVAHLATRAGDTAASTAEATVAVSTAAVAEHIAPILKASVQASVWEAVATVFNASAMLGVEEDHPEVRPLSLLDRPAEAVDENEEVPAADNEPSTTAITTVSAPSSPLPLPSLSGPIAADIARRLHGPLSNVVADIIASATSTLERTQHAVSQQWDAERREALAALADAAVNPNTTTLQADRDSQNSSELSRAKDRLVQIEAQLRESERSTHHTAVAADSTMAILRTALRTMKSTLCRLGAVQAPMIAAAVDSSSTLLEEGTVSPIRQHINNTSTTTSPGIGENSQCASVTVVDPVTQLFEISKVLLMRVNACCNELLQHQSSGARSNIASETAAASSGASKEDLWRLRSDLRSLKMEISASKSMLLGDVQALQQTAQATVRDRIDAFTERSLAVIETDLTALQGKFGDTRRLLVLNDDGNASLGFDNMNTTTGGNLSHAWVIRSAFGQSVEELLAALTTAAREALHALKTVHKRAIQDLQEELQNVNERFETLQVSDLSSRAHWLRDVQTALDEAQASEKTAERRATTLTEEICQLRGESMANAERIADLQKTNECLRASTVDALAMERERVAELRTALDAKSDLAQRATEQAQTLQEKLDAAQKSLSEKIECLHRDLSDARLRTQELEHQLEDAANFIAEMEAKEERDAAAYAAKISEQRREIMAKHSEGMASVEAHHHDRAARLQDRLDAAKAEVQRLTSEMERTRSEAAEEVKELRDQLAAAIERAYRESADRANADVTELEQEFIKKQISLEETLHKSQQEWAHRRSDLEAQLMALRTENSELRERNHTLEKDLQVLQSGPLSQLRRDDAAHRLQIEKLEAELSNAKTDVERSHSQLHQYEKSLLEAEQQLALAQSLQREAEKAAQSSAAERAKSLADMERLERELDVARREASTTRRDLHESEVEAVELQSRWKAAEMRASVSESSLHGLRTRIAELERLTSDAEALRERSEVSWQSRLTNLSRILTEEQRRNGELHRRMVDQQHGQNTAAATGSLARQHREHFTSSTSYSSSSLHSTADHRGMLSLTTAPTSTTATQQQQDASPLAPPAVAVAVVASTPLAQSYTGRYSNLALSIRSERARSASRTSNSSVPSTVMRASPIRAVAGGPSDSNVVNTGSSILRFKTRGGVGSAGAAVQGATTMNSAAAGSTAALNAVQGSPSPLHNSAMQLLVYSPDQPMPMNDEATTTTTTATKESLHATGSTGVHAFLQRPPMLADDANTTAAITTTSLFRHIKNRQQQPSELASNTMAGNNALTQQQSARKRFTMRSFDIASDEEEEGSPENGPSVSPAPVH